MARMATVLCLAATFLVPGASGAPSAASRTFQDAVGEDPAGPDITTVTVSSDDHTITFRVAIPTSPVVTPDFRLRIWLDADNDRSTGLSVEGEEPSGFDHFLIVDPTRFRADEAVLYRCAGSVCTPPALPVPLEFSYASGARFTVDARSLGLVRIDRVRFVVHAATGIGYDPVTRMYDFTNWRWDTAPDEGDWTFTARPLRVTALRATPAQPRAGGTLSIALGVVDNETGAALARGKVDCRLRVGGRLASSRAGQLSQGRARCRFEVPPAASGKRFRATVGVTAKGTALARSLTGRIR